MRWLAAFVAGALGVLIGHQVMLTLLHAVGFTSYAAWDMTSVPPLGVPALASHAFWGGVWGLVFVLLEPRLPRRPVAYWISVAAFGGVALTAVAVAVVLPIKGRPPVVDPPAAALTMGLLVNATWGVVTALFVKLFSKRSA